MEYPLVNYHRPWKHPILVETSFSTPVCQGRTVNLLDVDCSSLRSNGPRDLLSSQAILIGDYTAINDHNQG